MSIPKCRIRLYATAPRRAPTTRHEHSSPCNICRISTGASRVMKWRHVTGSPLGVREGYFFSEDKKHTHTHTKTTTTSYPRHKSIVLKRMRYHHGARFVSIIVRIHSILHNPPSWGHCFLRVNASARAHTRTHTYTYTRVRRYRLIFLSHKGLLRTSSRRERVCVCACL